MQQNTFRSLLVLLVTSVFFSCQKIIDYLPKPPQETTCDLTEAYVTAIENGGSRSQQFRKEYDAATGKVRKVVAGIFKSSGVTESVSMLLKYSGTDIYFVREASPADTLLRAVFNNGKVQRIVSYLQQEDGWGNFVEEQYGFFNTQFEYDYNGLLDYIGMDTYPDLKLTYDANGNVVRMYDPYDDSQTNDDNEPIGGTFYTYDLSVTAQRQFYADDFRTPTSNVFYLAKFLGWTPDLMPKNKRVSVKVIEREDFDPNDYYIRNLTDHVYDAKGNLLSYKTGANGPTYTSVWDCSKKK
jgi:hypothetical protein